ncbi:MAG: PAS domain S-box protein [Gemmatimonadota bacterium]
MSLPLDDAPRLLAVRATGLIDAPASPLLDGLTRILTRALAVPVALISLLDRDRQWLAGRASPPDWAPELRSVPLSDTFCSYLVAHRAPLLIADTRKDPISAGSRAVAELQVQAYAGVPLILNTGEALGALCAIDYQPRVWTAEEVEVLQDVARAVVVELELRVALSAHRASETRLASIIASATDSILTVDAGQRITLANAAAEQLFGYPSAELIGQPLNLLIPDDRQLLADQLDANDVSGDTTRSPRDASRRTVEGRRRDGSTFPTEPSISKVSTDGGELFTVITRDVSARAAHEAERAQVELALREGEERARVLFRESPLPTWVFDLETLQVRDVNAAACARYGYTREEFLALKVTDLRPAEDVPALMASIAASRRGAAFAEVFRHRTKSGEIFQVEITAQDTLYDGRPGRIVLAKDITERRRAEEALRRSEERYALAVRATGNAVWEWDLATDQITWGEGAALALGHPGPLPSDASWWDTHVHPEDSARVLNSLRAVIDGNGTDEWRETYQFQRHDGSYSTIVDRGSVQRDADGVPERLIGAMEDITAQVALESQLRQAQKMEAVGQLAGGIAHDFNNLLTIIQGNLEIVQADLTPAHPSAADLDEVRMAVDRAGALVRQLLTFSRQQPVRPEDVSVPAVLRHAEKLLRRVIGEEIRLLVDLTPQLALARVDPGQLEQVFMNLAVNARDAMLTPLHGHDGRGGTLAMKVDVVQLEVGGTFAWDQSRTGNWVRLVVRDTGHGMDADTQAHIFEPFFTTKAVGAGTGLGLATVFGIVRQAGGTIRVDSVLGRGTTFTVLLPAIIGAETQAEPVIAVPAPPAPSRVLLVEDEAGVRITTRRILERHGYTVLEARHGADALRLWRAHREDIDVVITDVRMPELGGPELMAQLHAESPMLPVVFVSGYSEAPPSIEGRAFEAFVQKPFTADALLTAVLDVVRAGESGAR